MSTSTTPPSAGRTAELRLALVMNGGVSLAVWMGGVTTEIARAVRERHPVYRDLLVLTRTRARVDVISGASAGGINGAALALALQCGTDVAQLRQVWMDKASFNDLLRDPGEPDPPSLMDGNNYFLPALTRAFENLYAGGPTQSVPLDLTLTATLLTAKQNVSTDDFGMPIQDAEHRARFHFTQEHFAKHDLQVAHRLAFAARATASFPVAFEPVFCKVGDKTDKDPDNYCDYVDFGNSRYLIDGGVLDNKPFEAALETVFNMRTGCEVRRVLAYIVPDPGITASKDPDKPDEIPNLGKVALESAFSIPAAETVTDQIKAIRDHNRKARAIREELVGLMRALTTMRQEAEPDLLPKSLFKMYYRHRLNGALDFVLDSVAQKLNEDSKKILGRRTRVWIKEVLISRYDRRLAQHARWVPKEWPAKKFADEENVANWQWGLYSVEFMSSVLLDLLRRGERMLKFLEYRNAEPQPFNAAPPASAQTDGSGLADPDLAATEPYGTPVTGSLAAYWSDAYALLARLKELRKKSAISWQECGKKLLTVLNTGGAGIEDDIEKWLVDSLGDPHVDTSEAERHEKLGHVALETAELILKIVKQLAEQKSMAEDLTRICRSDEAEEARAVLTMVEFLNKEKAGEVLDELLRLDVVQYAIGDRSDHADRVAVELVQISGCCSSPLGFALPLEEKLAGIQLAHFGAFYKRSWRANDWMHGRMDGSERLVRILLNPDRLHQLYAEKHRDGKNISKLVCDEIRRIAVDSVPSIQARRELAGKWNEGEILRELAFLDSLKARVPDTLEHCCGALVRRLHLAIVGEEVPEVAKAVTADRNGGADERGTGGNLLAEFMSQKTHEPSDFIELWQSRSLGQERISDELGSDLMTRTLSKTIAIAHRALSSSNAGVGPLRVLIGSLQLPVRMFYLVANQLLRESTTAAAVTLSLAVVGVLLVVLGFVVTDFPQSLIAFGWAVTAAGLLMAIVGAPRGVLTGGIFLLALAFVLAFFSFKPATVALLTGASLLVLWLFPALIGMALLVGAALLSIGTSGRGTIATWFCYQSPVAGRLGSICSGVSAELAESSLEHVQVVAFSVVTIVCIWLVWGVFPLVKSLDQRLKKLRLLTTGR